MSLRKEVDTLKQTLETHLIESGEIRSDLSWLKKAFWTLTASILTFGTILIGYAFNRVINK
jgi:hypothetical protein